MIEQKKFIDISRIKESENELVDTNTNGFRTGDNIVIQTKIDGSNSCIKYDKETDRLICFSRKKELSCDMTLNGFWGWVQTLDATPFENFPSYHFFGEWVTSHTVKYRPEIYKHWYVYDIWDSESECYLPQDKVKEWCETYGFIYINTWYVGKFVSWEHCRSFLNKTIYALNQEEGIVVKNMSELNNPCSKTPFYLKIINDSFSETKTRNHIKKVLDPQHEAEKAHAQEILDMIVTENRVNKEIHKMIDEGILPPKIEPKDVKIVAQTLPKRIFDDCIKEEKELVDEAGKYFGKLLNKQVMNIVRNIVLE